MSHHRLLAVLVIPFVLNACGGGGKGDDDDDNKGPNTAPVAAFTVSALTVSAGEALVFDASGSTDADGDDLTYSWSFGATGRGGTQRIAHVFSVAGDQPVTLTVSDGRDKHQVTQTVTVTSGAAPVGSAVTKVRVITPSLQPIEGATVRLVGGASATTDTTGNATLAIGTGVRQIIRVEAPGFARRTHVALLKDAATAGYLEIVMQSLGAARSLADAGAGGSIEVDTGAKVTVAGRALVGAAGTPVTGAVDVYVAPVDVTTRPRAFPGEFAGRNPDGQSTGIASYGTVDFNFMKDGEKLDLAPGATATIEIPVFPALDLDGNPVGVGKIIPLWSLDEESGQWIREGEGALVASASSPTGFVQRATVGHFSWWNCDDEIGPTDDADVGCCLDTDDDGDCDDPSPCFLSGRTCADASCDDDSYNVPLFGPSTSVDADDSERLLIPLQMHLAIEAFGPDGLTRGRYISAAGSAVPQSIQIVLTPFIAPPPDDEPILLPFDFTTATEATPTVYEADLEAGTSLYVGASRGGGSNVTGRVRLLSPSAEELENKTFNATAGAFIEAIPVSGRYQIEVSGIAPTPEGTYRLIVRVVGNDMSVVSVTPANGATVDPPSAITVTFSRPPKVSTVNASTFNLIGPAGEVAPVSNGITVSGVTATFIAPSFGPAMTYTVQLTTGITDDVNNALVAPFESTFTTTDVPLAFGQVLDISRMDTAASDDGTAMIVGQSGQRVVYSRYAPGAGWSSPAEVPGPGTGFYLDPAVAMTTGGKALVTYYWSTNGNSPYSAYATTYTPGVGFSAAVATPVNTTEGGPSVGNDNALALDGQGRALRFWAAAGVSSCWYSWFNGTTWSDAAQADDGQFCGTGNGRAVLNANGIGGIMWRNNFNAIVRRFDAATGEFGPVVDLGNNQSGSRELHVDDAGNLYAIRADGSLNAHITRLPYDTENETNYTFQIDGAWNTSNCPPTMAVTPSGKTAFFFCKSQAVPYVQTWDGDPSHARDPAVQLSTTSAARRARLANTNEDFVLVHSLNAVGTVYRRLSTGNVWETTDTAVPGLEVVIDSDRLVAADHGTTAVYVQGDGFAGRVR